MGKRTDEVGGAHAIDDTGAEVDTFTSSVAAGSFAGTPYSEGDPELYTEQVSVAAPYDAEMNADLDSDLNAEYESDVADDENPEIEQTRSQIEDTRAQMHDTIDAIQAKLSPANIAQQAKETVREATIGKAQDMVSNATDSAMDAVNSATDTAREAVSSAGDTARGFGNTVVETIRANPIPAALAGIGIGWLLMSSRNNSGSTTTDYRYSYSPGRQYDQYGYTRQRDWDDQYRSYNYNAGQPSTMERAQGAVSNATQSAQQATSNVAGQVSDTASSMASTVSDTASNVAGQVSDTAGQAVQGMQDTASQLGAQAQYGVRQARTGMEQMMHENPLAVGVIAIGLGAAVGLAIPETEKENELMGEQRDQLMQQAQQNLQQVAQKAQTVAQEAVGAAKDAAQSSAQDQGLTGH